MFRVFAAALTAFGLCTGSAHAIEVKDGGIIVRQLSSGTRLGFEPVQFPDGVRGMTIQVVGPDGYEANVKSGKRLPELDLAKFGKVADGEYFYEITGGTGDRTPRKEKVNNGRDDEDPSLYRFANFALSGRILVEGGKIVEFEQMVEKGSEKTVPGEDVKDFDEGYKEAEDPGRRPKEADDSDKG